jgi:hypothetical protein
VADRLQGRQTNEQATASAAQINYPREARSVIVAVAIISLGFFVVVQPIHVLRDNPPVQSTVQWDSPQTEQLWNRTCANCHSNTTTWPWYSYIAPSSWLTTLHVHDARQAFNMSELDKVPAFIKRQFPNNAGERIRMGTMPPPDYLILHPEARLSEAEKQQLIDGLEKTLGQ